MNGKTKKKWYLRWWAYVLYAFVILFIIGSFSDKTSIQQTLSDTPGSENNIQNEPQQTTKVSSNTVTEVTKQQTPKQNSVLTELTPIHLSGFGQQASSKFNLESGLTIFRITHSGQSHFSAWLIDNNGNNVELLVNTIGNFNGSKAVGIIKDGTHILDVSADGPWTITVEQPRPITAQSIPKTFIGTGQQVSDFTSIPKGLTTFRMTHNGQSNFSVWLLDNKGQNVELLVNKIGAFNGSKAVGIPRTGIYLLDISADGNWSFTID